MSRKLAEMSDANHGAFTIVSVLCVPVRGFSGGLFDLLHIDLINGGALGSGSLPKSNEI